MTESPLSLDTLGDISDACKNSELAIKVDLLDWSRISKDFQEHILKRNAILKD